MIINMQTKLMGESLHWGPMRTHESKQAYLELKGTAVAGAIRSTCICARATHLMLIAHHIKSCITKPRLNMPYIRPLQSETAQPCAKQCSISLADDMIVIDIHVCHWTSLRVSHSLSSHKMHSYSTTGSVC